MALTLEDPGDQVEEGRLVVDDEDDPGAVAVRQRRSGDRSRRPGVDIRREAPDERGQLDRRDLELGGHPVEAGPDLVESARTGQVLDLPTEA